MLTSPGVADTVKFLMNTWNTQQESYQQTVYTHPGATVKCQIEQAENQTHAMGIKVEAVHVDNTKLLHFKSSEVILVEPEI
jgi:hypothetical protein